MTEAGWQSSNVTRSGLTKSDEAQTQYPHATHDAPSIMSLWFSEHKGSQQNNISDLKYSEGIAT